MDINTELKSEFKNFLSEGLRIYASERRPANQIASFLPKDKNCFVWDKHDRFLLCYGTLSKNELTRNDIKEYSYKYMDFKDNVVKLNLPELFDNKLFDLKEALSKNGLTEREVYPYFKDWCDLEDLDIITEGVKKELE